MIVTNIPRILYKGTKHEITKKGIYLDGYLAENFDPIKTYLNKGFDLLGIISGGGDVGCGKSTLSFSVGLYLAWLVAGGRMNFARDSKGKLIRGILKSPTKPVRFNLKENVVFSVEELKTRSTQLFEKYGQNNIIILDEAKGGTDSKKVMSSINAELENFFDESRFMGNLVILVLPSFFSLAHYYAVTRSLFLLDAFLTPSMERGRFRFYNKRSKEFLYSLGKKKVTSFDKYNTCKPNFYGKFTKWVPFDYNEYEGMKIKALKSKIQQRKERNSTLQRDLLLWYLNKTLKIRDSEILKIYDDVLDVQLTKRSLRLSREKINELISRSKELKPLHV